jgi:hypothetical protein
MINRVEASIAKVAPLVEGKPTDFLRPENDDFVLLPIDHTALQDLQARSFASDRITLEEATSLFTLLGHSPSVFNDRPLATRMGVLMFLAALAAKAQL